jgi:hypothetical protein
MRVSQRLLATVATEQIVINEAINVAIRNCGDDLAPRPKITVLA